MDTLREAVFSYVKSKYGSTVEYPWMRYPDYAVFRHEDNRKWYAVVMDVERKRIGVPGEGCVDTVAVKTGDLFLNDLLKKEEGFRQAYHFGRGDWLTVLLDGTVQLERIEDLIDRSYRATASAKTRQKIRPPKEWVIPSNPKYYDIVGAFRQQKEISWKQGKGIKSGDTVFMYVGQPYSAILYQCLVTQTDIPYQFEREGLRIDGLMKIRLQREYDPKEFTFERLNQDYGIFAVRGPRGIPASLSRDLKK